MKRLSAVVLTLVLVLSMATAVFADDTVLTDGESMVTNGTYTYTATQTGTLYYGVTYYDYDYGYGLTGENQIDCIIDDIATGYFWLKVNGEECLDGYYGSLEVAENDTVTFEFYYDGTLDANFDLNYTGLVVATPGSSASNPISVILRQCPLQGEAIAAGETLYYEFNGSFSGSVISITGDVTVEIGSYNYETDDYDWTVCTANEDGISDAVAGYMTLLRFTNNGDTDTTFDIGYYYATGSAQNPDSIVVGTDATVDFAEGSNFYYYKWVASEAGSLTVAVSATNGWQYSVDVNNESGSIHYSDDDPVVSSLTFEVSADDIVKIYVANYDTEAWPYPATTVTVSLTFAAESGSDSSSSSESSAPAEDTLINYEKTEETVAAEDVADENTEWVSVDIFDEVKDTAVKGEDGYFHLNSADGPVLFIDFNDEEFISSLSEMNSTGGIKYTVINEDGSKERGQYKLMVASYLEVSESGLVALTQELIDMMKKVGDGQGWYTWNAEWTFMLDEGETIDADEAWMFRCKYSEDIVSLANDDDSSEPVESDDSYDSSESTDSYESSESNDSVDSGDASSESSESVDSGETSGDDIIPGTGDAFNIVLLLVVMLSAATVLVISRKSIKAAK